MAAIAKTKSVLRVGVLGCGFWSRYQISAWREAGGVEIVALCDPDLKKAKHLGGMFQVPAVYDSPESLLHLEKIDLVDVVTPVETHAACVRLAAVAGVTVICQKPMGRSFAEAKSMVQTCRQAGVGFYVHENFRWQVPIRALKRILDEGHIGSPFRARLDFISGFPVFKNQPILRELEQFILTDIGSHTLDVARFLFGEASTLYCQTQRAHRDIRGEDVATVMMRMSGCPTVLCQMAYAENYLEREAFPQTLAFIEGTRGSIELTADYWIRVTTQHGTDAKRWPPVRYDWVDPAYDVVQSSMVACHQNLLSAIRGEGTAETTGQDNLRTMQLVFGAYESAARNEAIALPSPETMT